MAVVGHWLVGFLFSYCFPEAGVALFLKLSMFSDGAVLLFSVLGLESAVGYASWMPSVPAETATAIAAWKRDGKWVGSDPTPGSGGFGGFDGVFPFYLDVSYSHSVLFCALLGTAIAVGYRLYLPAARPLVCVAIWATVLSHPLMDIFFHDACLARVTRGSVGGSAPPTPRPPSLHGGSMVQERPTMISNAPGLVSHR